MKTDMQLHSDVLALAIAGSEMHDDADIAHAAARTLNYLALGKENAVKVLVEDGWIELTGKLEWDFQRRAIEAVLLQVAGVKGIDSHVTLGPQGPGRGRPEVRYRTDPRGPGRASSLLSLRDSPS